MICDLAETYHVLNYQELPPCLVATLVLGLRNNSRVKMFFSNSNLTVEEILLAIIADNVQFQSWTKTKEAKKGKQYKKKSYLKALQGDYSKDKDELQIFKSEEELLHYLKQFENR